MKHLYLFLFFLSFCTVTYSQNVAIFWDDNYFDERYKPKYFCSDNREVDSLTYCNEPGGSSPSDFFVYSKQRFKYNDFNLLIEYISKRNPEINIEKFDFSNWQEKTLEANTIILPYISKADFLLDSPDGFKSFLHDMVTGGNDLIILNPVVTDKDYLIQDIVFESGFMRPIDRSIQLEIQPYFGVEYYNDVFGHEIELNIDNELCTQFSNISSLDITPIATMPSCGSYAIRIKEGKGSAHIFSYNVDEWNPLLDYDQYLESIYKAINFNNPTPLFSCGDLLSSTKITDASCLNSSDGGIKIYKGHLPSDAQIVWSDGVSGEWERTGLASGDYEAYVSSKSERCLDDTLYMYVGNPGAFDYEVVTRDPDPCVAGDATAEIIMNNPDDYDIEWSSGAKGTELRNFTPGTHTIKFTSKYGCLTEPLEITVELEEQPTFEPTLVMDHNGCSDGAYRDIRVDIPNATSQESVFWSDGHTGMTHPDIDGDAADLFATVSRGEQCYATLKVQQEKAVMGLVLRRGHDGGQGNGYIRTYIRGGVHPLTYTWSDGEEGSSRTGLSAGIYTLTVTDANGCSRSWDIEIRGHSTTAYTMSLPYIETKGVEFKHLSDTEQKEALMALSQPGHIDVIVSPNPVQRSFTIQIPHQTEICQITLYDNTGKKQRSLLSHSDQYIVIDRGDLPAGLYLLEVLSGDNRSTKKIMFQ